MTDTLTSARIVIASIETKDGHKISPPIGGVTVVVGGNNAGKSTFLRETAEFISTESHLKPNPKIITNPTLQTKTTEDELLHTLRRAGLYQDRGGANTGYKLGGLVPQNIVINAWRNIGNNQLGRLASFFISHVTATNRIQGIAPQSRRADIGDLAETPMHILEDNPELLEKIQGISLRIFRQTLTLDRLSNEIKLRVGKPMVPAPPIDSVTKEYRDALIALEPLHTQGDGMTAVLGLLVPMICGRQQVVLIDEPEAFLHPPQARIVGKLLGELAKEKELQVLLATHDRNILIGLLQSKVPVTVIRLDRSTSPTSVHELEYSQVRQLWDDPVLRYSNLLDGLFHHAVVLCEAERDCTFYSASLDIASESSTLPFSSGDILFVPTGGKDGFSGMVKALKAVSVPVIAIPDIDILNDESKLRTLLEAMGGDWNKVQANYKVATASFRQPRQEITNAQILKAVSDLLNPILAERYNHETQDSLRVAMRLNPSPWAELKRYGVDAFQGQARQAATKMFDQLRELGLVIVEKGELESLAPSVQSRKGKQWLTEALEKQAYRDPLAQAHIERVIHAIGLLTRTSQED